MDKNYLPIFFYAKITNLANILIHLHMLARFVNQKFFRKNIEELRNRYHYYPAPDDTPIVFGLKSSNHISLADLPAHFILIVLLNEDNRFFQHRGFNWPEIRRRITNYLSGVGVRGSGSSITQQLVRPLFNLRSSNILRKLVEASLALEMEQSFSKEEILELYLSSLFLGHTRIFGVTEFARRYFGKIPRDLSITESMYLAQIIRDPTRRQYRDLMNRPAPNFDYNLSFIKFRDFFLFYYSEFGAQPIESPRDLSSHDLIDRLKAYKPGGPIEIDRLIYTALENRALFSALELKKLIALFPIRSKEIIDSKSYV